MGIMPVVICNNVFISDVDFSDADFSGRQFFLNNSAAIGLVIGALSLLALTLPFLYLAFLKNQGNGNNANGSYGYGYGSSASSSYGHSSARIWNDQKAAENDIEWFHRIQKFIANGNNDYS